MNNINAKYGLSGLNEERFSFVRGLWRCKRGCDWSYASNKTKRQECKANCEEKYGAISEPEPEPSPEPSPEPGDDKDNGKEAGTGKLLQTILIGFLALVLLLVLIWGGHAIYKRMTK